MITDEQRTQYAREIQWLEREIEKLAVRLPKKPRVQKQINDYRRQIKERQYQIDLGV